VCARSDDLGKSQLAQRRHRVRGEREPKPQFARRLRAFEDSDVPAGLAQRNAG
jgi:hypothetical protein